MDLGTGMLAEQGAFGCINATEMGVFGPEVGAIMGGLRLRNKVLEDPFCAMVWEVMRFVIVVCK